MGDTCGTATVVNDFQGTTPNVGCNTPTTVRFNARDQCGNVSPQQSATFTVTDSTNPTLTNPAQSQTVECGSGVQNSYQTWLTNRAGATATDSCSSVTWSNNGPATITSGCSVNQEVTFTARDNCQNSVGATATDNCGTVTWTNNFTALTGTCVQTANVIFTATDPCGLTATTSATYTVSDTSAPIISPQAQSQSVSCDASSNQSAYQAWVADNGGARATDLCQAPETLVWTNNQQPSPQGCATVAVTFTVTDACDHRATTSASYTVFDRTAPSFTTPPQSTSVECNGVGNVDQYQQWVASNAGAIATDVCAVTITITNNAPSQGPVGCGTIPVIFTATDGCQNAQAATATFTVTDTTPPTINTPASDQTVQCAPPTDVNAVQTWLESRAGTTASDNCYAQNALVWTNNYNGLQNQGCNRVAEVTFTVRDPCAAGTSQTTGTFSIIDTLAPTIQTPASAIVLECDRTTNTATITNYVNSRGGAMATDTCSGVTWTNNFVNPPTPCGAPVNIIFTAADACGNQVSTTGSIQIEDTVQPDFVDFPGDAMIGCDQTPDVSRTGEPDVFDACTVEPTLSHTDVSFQEPAEGLCPGDIIITRTWRLVDACGNVRTRDQTIVQVIARSTGECTPSQCPPCVGVECCEFTEDIACNPVPCTPVNCRAVNCNPVPCIPQACGVNPTPTGNPEGPIPLPSVIPNPSCEPVYIYVFDDDDVDLYPDEPGYYGASSSGASTLQACLLLVVVTVVALLF